MADPLEELERMFGVWSGWVTAPNDPDLTKWLREAGLDYKSGGPGLITFFWIGAPRGKAKEPQGQTSPGGGGGSRGGGGGGGGGFGGPAFTTQFGRELSQREYEILAANLKSVAYRYGKPLDDAMVRLLIKREVAPEELLDRLLAITRIEENKTVLNQFEKTLAARGLAKKFDFKDRLDFILGRAPDQWRDLWEEASTRGAAAQAGFRIFNKPQTLRHADRKGMVEDLALTRQEVLRVGRKLGEPLTEESARPIFQQAARLALELLPLSRLKGYKLTKSELLDASAGVAGVGTEQKIQRLLDEQRSFFEKRAPGLYQTGRAGSLAGPMGA
jgi:hypothetical protein